MADERDVSNPADSEEPVGNAAAGARSGKGTMLVILIGLLVMMLTPLITFFVVRATLLPSDMPEKAIHRDSAAAGAAILTVDPLVVNITGTRMTRVLRVQTHLILSEMRLEQILSDMMPMIKDRIMTTASRRTLDELESADDRDSLKRDIIVEINSMIRDRMAGSVLDVAFSEFLVQ